MRLFPPLAVTLILILINDNIVSRKGDYCNPSAVPGLNNSFHVLNRGHAKGKTPMTGSQKLNYAQEAIYIYSTAAILDVKRDGYFIWSEEGVTPVG